jgi:hypothetical protein
MEKIKLTPDKLYSTYYWVINLDPRHAINSPNVLVFHGYSKFSGHDEAKDKAMLLMKKIIMLHSNGYLGRSRSIIFYMKRGDFLDKSNAIILFSLTKRDFKIHPECILDKTFYSDFFTKKGILNFLNRFYDCLLNNKEVKHLLPIQKATFSKDDYLNVEIQTFSSHKQLHAYCQRMINNGHPFEAVMNFMLKYLERKPFI